MGRSIVITSGKGGVGKTTSTANIGTALAMLGAGTVLIDADVGLRNLDVVLGMESDIVYNLIDVAAGASRIKQALIRDKNHANLRLLPSSQAADKSVLDEGAMKRIAGELRDEFDYVIIDCPAGIEQGFRSAVAGAEEAIVVVTPEVSSIRDADRILTLLRAGGMTKCSLLINRVRFELIKSGEMIGIEDILDILDAPLLGLIPEEAGVLGSTNRGAALVGGSSPAANAYMNVARRLMGEAVDIAVDLPRRGFFSRLAAFFAL